jgi:tetratricopeptide (TPR) repeat protein
MSNFSKKIILVFCLFLLKNIVFAGKYFDFTPRVRDAYDKVHCMRLVEAAAALEDLRKNEPDNLLSFVVQDHLDFLRVFTGADEKAFAQLGKQANKSLVELAKGDPKSPYFLFSQAMVRLHLAILNGKYNKYVAAISEVKQAYSLLTENERKHPDFIINKLPLGVMHALIGTIPDEFRWAVKLVGNVSGEVNSGIAEVESVIEYGQKHPEFPFLNETLFTYSFLLMHVGNESERAWKIVKQSSLNPKENPLAAFAIANLAIKTARNDEAISTLENMPVGGAFHPFPYRNFLLGLAKLYRLDPDANQFLEAWVANPVGVYYVKEGYQKLAWYHLINGNEGGYHYYIDFCKTKGSDKIEGDNAAKREAEKGEMPNPQLLRARILFDGGYFQQANDYLKSKSANFTQAKDRLEFHYRMGRINQKLGKSAEALQSFQNTIDEGASQPWYFACNAALQMGIIYEEQKKWPLARVSFKKCISIVPEEYSLSLHQKAKAGLSRMKGKK